jgi:hypothetical protein
MSHFWVGDEPLRGFFQNPSGQKKLFQTTISAVDRKSRHFYIKLIH